MGVRVPPSAPYLRFEYAAHSGLRKAELRSRFAGLRWKDDISFDSYLAEVGDVRKRGYAVDQSQYAKGVTTVSSAVLDGLGKPLMAISAVGFGAKMTKADVKALGEDLRDRATAVFVAMAGQRPQR